MMFAFPLNNLGLTLGIRMTGTVQATRRGAGRPRRYVAANRIRELRLQGLSFRQIARVTGFGYGTIRRAYFSDFSDTLEQQEAKQV